MASEEHLAILKQGVDTWNKWRKEHLEIRPDLSRVLLRGADFSEADLRRTTLRGTDLSRARLRGADFSEADLRGSGISEADLRRTAFRGADLSGADLRGSDLSDAVLREALLNEADLSGTDLSRAVLRDMDMSAARIGWTVLGNVDLSEVKGLDTVTHAGPSTIGVDTITKSQGKIPEVFLRGVGMPDIFITFMQSLTSEAIQFYSCFISYSSKDDDFAERLHADLQAKGVRCWYAPEDLKIGEPFLLGIEQGIRLHDKLLLVLSEHSVASGWVQHEVLSAMAKEQGKPPWVLFPIRADDAIMNTSVPWATMIKQSRHIGDFTRWKDHDAYQKAFERLLRDLKAEG